MNVTYYDQRWKIENEFASPPSPGRLNQIAKLLETYAKSSNRQRLIDIGCGNGWILQHIVNHFPSKFQVFGVEPSAAGAMNARQRVPSATVFEQTLENFKCDAPFDVLICSEVIEHVEDSRKFLLQIHNLLADDGIVILTTPNGDYRNRFFKDNLEACEQPIENWLTSNDLRKMCSDRLDVQSLDTFNPKFFFDSHPFFRWIRLSVEKIPCGKYLRRIADGFVCRKLQKGLYIRAVLKRQQANS